MLQAFPWVSDQRTRNESQREGRGWGRKEGRACRQTPWIWKPSTWPVMPECTHGNLMLLSALINWPIKCLTFHGAEVNFWGHTSLSKYFGSRAWVAGMEKSHWIQTINVGFVIAASKLNLSFSSAYKEGLQGWSFEVFNFRSATRVFV